MNTSVQKKIQKTHGSHLGNWNKALNSFRDMLKDDSYET